MEQTRQATILVVDDDEIHCKLVESLLGAEGYTVRSAASGEEALDAIAAQLPDLILLDIVMPGIDGFEVARRLKADSRSNAIPIIMVTSLEDPETRLKGLEVGAEEFLTKPVGRAELVLRVRNLLNVKEYQDFLANHNRILEEQVQQRTATLMEREERLRVVTETARDAIIVLEGEGGTTTEWNPAAEAIFGYSREEMIGQALHEMLTPPRFREAMRLGMEHFAKTGEGAVIGKTLELTALHKNGTEFPIELSLSAMRINGAWYATGIARDITERKQVESQLAEQLDELRRWHEVTLGREMRTLELKREVNEVLGQAGQPPRYTSVEQDETTSPDIS